MNLIKLNGGIKRKAGQKHIRKFVYGRKFLSIPKAAPETSRNSHKDINFVLHVIQAVDSMAFGPSNVTSAI